MIILTELSTRIPAPDAISDGLGVWRYSFGGDEIYTDDLGATFFWGGRQEIINIRGVSVGVTNYLEVASVAACQANEESFYWDDANKRIYIHHAGNSNDYAIGGGVYRMLSVSAGYATGRFRGQASFYDELYYDPRILGIGSLQKQVDPLKFGLLSFESSSYELGNQDGLFDSFSNAEALNAQVRFVLMQAGDASIDNGTRIFTGYTGGADPSDTTMSVKLSEARLFYNRAVCPNTFNSTIFASIDDKYAGRRIPVAYGEIRRGIAVPIDTGSFDKATGGTVTFKLADDAIHGILGVDALYDDNGNSVTLGTVSLSACTVQTSIAAGADVDLDRFSWRGQGYDIPGTYDNGLDIVKDALAEQAEIPFVSTTYDTTEWNTQTDANTQSIGLSIQSERGVIDEVVEPITVSLQGIVDVLGDGRLTFRPRDPDAGISRVIYQDEIIGVPDFEINTEDVVSTVVVQYAPSFVNQDNSLTAIYTDDRESVTAGYGIDSPKPVSPVKTVLVDEADALAVGAEIATTSTDPQRFVSITLPIDTETISLFDVVQIDVGRPRTEDWKVYEVLDKSLGIQGGLIVNKIRARLLPDRTTITEETRATTTGEPRVTTDGDERGIIEL